MMKNNLLIAFALCFGALSFVIWLGSGPSKEQNLPKDSFRAFLKFHAGIKDNAPKPYTEMSWMEFIKEVNPWKPVRKTNICDDQIPCLIAEVIKTKINILLTFSGDFAAGLGSKLKEYKLAGLIVCSVSTIYMNSRLILIFFADFCVLCY